MLTVIKMNRCDRANRWDLVGTLLIPTQLSAPEAGWPTHPDPPCSLMSPRRGKYWIGLPPWHPWFQHRCLQIKGTRSHCGWDAWREQCFITPSALTLHKSCHAAVPTQQTDYVRIILISTFIVCMQMYIPKTSPLKSSPLGWYPWAFSVNPFT